MKITEKKDHQNKNMIAIGFPWVSGVVRHRLIHDGTPEERMAFVQKHLRITLGCLILFFVLWQVLSYTSHTRPAPPAPALESVGTITDIQLHSTAFATKTTVTTAGGIFQVRGGVSAVKGDVAQLKTETIGNVTTKSLCVDSKIKSKCYPLQ